MATSIHHDTRAGFDSAGFALRSLSARYHDWAEKRRRIARVTAELHAYTDRQLQDLGLSRGDIPEVARGTFRRA